MYETLSAEEQKDARAEAADLFELYEEMLGKLYEVTERLRSPVFEEEKVEELYGEILMAAKAPKKEGKGYEYPVMGHVVGLDGKIQGERRRLLHMAGY